MRIALVNISINPARGSDLVTLELAERLSSEHAVSVFSLRETTFSSANFQVICPSLRGGILSFISFLSRIRSDLQGFDVVNCHHALLSLLLPKKRLVTTYHGFRGRLNLRLGPKLGEWVSNLVRQVVIRQALRRSRAVVLVSNSLKSEVSPGSVRSLQVIYNGVDAPALPSSRSAPEHFLYVGRLDPDKNVGELLEAYRACPGLPPLLLAGDGSERRSLEAEFACDRIRFLGRVGADELRSLYARSHAFVTASTFETFCLPVIEAAHQGCPSIGCRSGSLPEVIQDGVTGWLLNDFASEAPSAFRVAVERCAEERGKMAARCRQWADGFSWNTALRQYTELYSSIV